MGSTTKEKIVGFVHGAQVYKKLGPAEIEREGTVHQGQHALWSPA